MTRKPMFTEEEVDKLAELYRTGATLQELATQHRVSVPTISNYLKRAGVELRGRGRPKGRTSRLKSDEIQIIHEEPTQRELPLEQLDELPEVEEEEVFETPAFPGSGRTIIDF